MCIYVNYINSLSKILTNIMKTSINYALYFIYVFSWCPYSQTSVDLVAEPTVSDVDYQWDMLYPGDCIFIPSQYAHQVATTTRYQVPGSYY